MPSIGSIFVDFVARTAGFQQGVQQAAGQVQQAGQQMAQSNALTGASADKMAGIMEKSFLRVVVGAHAFSLIRAEIKDVIKNIEDIPGVPQDTIDSIERMKYSLEGANGVLKPAIATMLGWFQNLGEGIGYGLGELIYGSEAVDDAFAKMNKEAKDFATKDFRKKMTELREEMERAGLSVGNLGDALLAEAAKLDAFASSASGTQKERQDAAIKAMQDRIAAQRITTQLEKEGHDISARIAAQDEQIENRGFRNKAARLADLMKQRDALEKERFAFTGNKLGGDLSPSDQEALDELGKKLEKLNIEIIPLQKFVRSASDEMLGAFTHAMQGMGDQLAAFVVDGKTSFGDFARSVEKQILSMTIQFSLINPLLNFAFGAGGLTKSGVSNWTELQHFAVGGRPPTGQASLIGEQGPELFIPDSAGTVVSNSALRGMSGGGGPSVSYNIDARGADVGVVAKIQAVLENHIVNHDRSVIGSVVGQIRRGGSAGRALSGA